MQLPTTSQRLVDKGEQNKINVIGRDIKLEKIPCKGIVMLL